ncbi:SDR family NAD(P)-dependent oxidoreductase [Alphaproteobacteria bacterium]|nr:SDR family NAD(P)-dependent oxidoreductase [Alphaproteobacteria bacterium]MDA8622617.1 SDR family NAD(P)-dependent oxidoreductase [bacterium]MDA8625115.1 SDR family NAD(P)-dependent oxidoreductase [Alphaproteobacteria bacterium]MDA8642474.1 SDR family NAD(P)-dependent oxidoreductase [Alphaproteobacteria bacterium]MDA8666790.1 SDR family NAD(P)-dependent oxidoreductase [Alphaproteobacteria bacterium]
MIARLSPYPLKRLRTSIVGQRRQISSCPSLPQLRGKIAVVTGANDGIGKETARGLLERGAEVIMLCRNIDKAEQARRGFLAEGLNARSMCLIECDLADLDSVKAAAQAVNYYLHGRKIDILVENAGVWARHYDETEQGHEINFGTNVLGHFALRRELMTGSLALRARIIILTGDFYIMAEGCSPSYHWHSRLGGMRAYNRSKLGNLWIARELQRRHPDLNVFAVHPGVVASGLGNGGKFAAWLKRALLITPQDGAQTTLMCASQEDLTHGSYYHNVHGECELDNADPATNDEAAARLWARCMEMTANMGRPVAIRLAS